MSKLLHIGVLGCSAFAKRAIIPAICELGEHYVLTGIASRDIEKARDVASKYSSTAFSYQSLIDDPATEAVYIPLPNSMHAEWIEKALMAGKHVLVEKSMTCTHADTKRLNDLARGKKLVLVENFQFRFHRQLREIKDIISSGTLGELRCIRSSFGFPPFPDADNIRYSTELGGGALLDAGTYPIKISQIIMGYNISVKAARLNNDEHRGINIWGGGFLQQNDGPLFSEIAFGFDHLYQCNAELWGSKGKLTATRLFTAAPGVSPDLILETAGSAKTISVPSDNHFANMLQHFHVLTTVPEKAEDEYIQNINQARLLEEFKNKSNE